MAEEYILRQEHEEFARRLEDEHTRLGKRISILEQNAQRITDLTVEIKELTLQIKTMVAEMGKHGERLDKLEARDGERWRQVTSYVVTAIAGAVVAFLMAKIGIS